MMNDSPKDFCSLAAGGEQLADNLADFVGVGFGADTAQQGDRACLAQEFGEGGPKPFLDAVDSSGSGAHGNDAD